MKKYISVFVLVLLLVPAFGLAQTGWSNPPSNPPDCTNPSVPGCNPPINTGNVNQAKSGKLSVLGLMSLVSDSLEWAGIFSGPATGGARLQLTNPEGSSYFAADGNKLYIGRSTPSPTNDIVIIDNSSKRVGIGVNPAATLDVNGNICYIADGQRLCLGEGSTGDPGGDGNDGNDGTTGDGVGSDFLYTSWDGCVAAGGCLTRAGSPGPTAQPVFGILNSGTWRMTCPAGYHVINGGAECKPPISFPIVKASTLNTNRPVGTDSWDVQCSTFWNTYVGNFVDATFNAMDRASITCAK